MRYTVDWDVGGGMAIVFFDETRRVFAKGYAEDNRTGVDKLRVLWRRCFGTAPPF